MKLNNLKLKTFLVILLLVILVSIALYWLYASKFETKPLVKAGKNEHTDAIWQAPDTGLSWTKCSIGQHLEKKADASFECKGEAGLFSWDEAHQTVVRLNQQNYLGYSDWRLPHPIDLATIISCENGFQDKTTIQYLEQNKTVNKVVSVGCVGKNYKRPTVNHQIFPNAYSEWYWSSLPYTQTSGESPTAWGVYLSSGYIYDLSKSTVGYVLLVR